MKLISFYFIFISFSLFFSQEKKDLHFFDYEKDKKWIKKVESMKMPTTALLKNKQINVEEYYNYVNTLSNLTIDYNPIIKQYIDKYLSYRWMPRIYGLLEFYTPLFEAKLKQYGLPTDLKYLAIVESNMNPVAGSWAGASGLWQFMPATGANYNLGKSSKINLFYDPYMSTDAACRYLKYLYGLFKDWNLVLSAYNCGEGRVMDKIKVAKSKNYWVVRNYLPDETKAYAPSFHAVRYIGKAYALYYDILPKLRYDFSDVREFKVSHQITFRQFAYINQMDLETLYFLNPHIVTQIIPANTFVYYIKK